MKFARADSLDAQLTLTAEEPASQPRSPRRGPPRTNPAKVSRYFAETEQMLRTGCWTDAEAGHVVALYALMHERVYGARPAELAGGADFGLARIAAARLLDKEFAGEVDRMVAFVEWSWRKAAIRRANDVAQSREVRRMGWRLQFSPSLLTDWRVARSVTR